MSDCFHDDPRINLSGPDGLFGRWRWPPWPSVRAFSAGGIGSALIDKSLRPARSGEAFMALELVPGALAGSSDRVAYPEIFGNIA